MTETTFSIFFANAQALSVNIKCFGGESGGFTGGSVPSG
jgi:hypothetical protein